MPSRLHGPVEQALRRRREHAAAALLPPEVRRPYRRKRPTLGCGKFCWHCRWKKHFGEPTLGDRRSLLRLRDQLEDLSAPTIAKE